MQQKEELDILEMNRDCIFSSVKEANVTGIPHALCVGCPARMPYVIYLSVRNNRWIYKCLFSQLYNHPIGIDTINLTDCIDFTWFCCWKPNLYYIKLSGTASIYTRYNLTFKKSQCDRDLCLIIDDMNITLLQGTISTHQYLNAMR